MYKCMEKIYYFEVKMKIRDAPTPRASLLPTPIHALIR